MRWVLNNLHTSEIMLTDGSVLAFQRICVVPMVCGKENRGTLADTAANVHFRGEEW